MAYVLETNGLTKRYGSRMAVKDISMRVPEGAIYGLIGRNGAGKTTVMKLAASLIRPTAGGLSLKAGSRMGTLIEAPSVYPDCSVRDNLVYKALAMGVKTSEADRLIRLVELQNAARKRARQLSLGMKQRLGIALALMGDPDFLMLDEPINGMDPQGIAFVRELLQTLNRQRGTAILLSSHVLDELGKLATHVGIIRDGQLVEEETMDELKARSLPTLFIRTGEQQQAQAVLREMGVPFTLENGALVVKEGAERHGAIRRALFDRRVYVEEFTVARQTLEEYFIGHTGGSGIV